MVENKFVHLSITLLWLTGGFGTFLSLLYMIQYRRRHWWNIGSTVSVPRTLVPLYGSLVLFCAGLALHSYTTQMGIARWTMLLWGVMTLLFAIQGIQVMAEALAEGWDTPLMAQFEEGGGSASALFSALAAGALVINVGLLGWWGSTQMDARAFDAISLWRGGSVSATVAPVPATAVAGQTLVPYVAAAISPAPPSTTDAPLESSITEVQRAATAQAQLGLLAGAAPAIVTLAPPALQLTPPAVAISGRTGSAGTASGQTVTTTLSQRTAVEGEIAGVAITNSVTTSVVIATVTAAVEETPPPRTVTIRGQRGVNVRRGPSLNARILTVLRTGHTATALGRTARGDWLSIELADGTIGWISTPLTVLEGPVETLPVRE